MTESKPTDRDDSPPGEVEQISNWPYETKYQQSPVDHFSIDRLPVRSRRQAMLLAFFLGTLGLQRLYLRRPALGWFCLTLSNLGLVAGLILLLSGWLATGLIVLVGCPAIAWLVAMGDLVALATGLVKVDGLGKPLGP